MPLNKSGSKAAIGQNIKTEEAAGRPHDQAVAIALETDRRAGGGNAKPRHTRNGQYVTGKKHPATRHY
jgi:hypothetical protein